MTQKQTEKDKANETEAQRIISHLYSVSIGHRDVVTRGVAQKILLHEFFTRDGNIYYPRAKSRGCGVYEIWLEPKYK